MLESIKQYVTLRGERAGGQQKCQGNFFADFNGFGNKKVFLSFSGLRNVKFITDIVRLKVDTQTLTTEFEEVFCLSLWEDEKLQQQITQKFSLKFRFFTV